MARSKSTSDRAAQDAGTSGSAKGGKAAWKLLDRGSVVAAGVLAPALSKGAWRLATGRRPPTSSRSPEVDVREAVAWAVVGGALVEVVKVVVRRQAAEYWVRSTGELPPGMKSTKPLDAEKPASMSKPASRSRRGIRR